MSKVLGEHTLSFIYWTRRELNKQFFYRKDIDIVKNEALIAFLEAKIDYINLKHDKVKRIYGIARNELKVKKLLKRNIYIVNLRKRKGYRAILAKQKQQHWFIPVRFFQALRNFWRVVFFWSGGDISIIPPYPYPFYANGEKELAEIEVYDKRKLQLWDTYFNKFEYFILVKTKTGFRIQEIAKHKYPSIKISMLFEWGYLPPRLKWYTTFNTNKKGEAKVRIEIKELTKEINAFLKK